MSRRAGLILLGIAVVLTMAVLLASPGIRSQFDETQIRDMAARAGPWGPAVIIVLMTIAVVFSPIPSAPIALAAGALYGHRAGTLYVVAGAEAGALIAFGLARLLGARTVSRWFGDRLAQMHLAGSQLFLMWLVFVSRLMPFVSFDLVSYAAGLSPLAFWRFAVATFAGILPASFLLAHLGGEMAGSPAGRTLWLVFGLGLLTGLPVIWGMARRYKRSDPRADGSINGSDRKDARAGQGVAPNSGSR